MTAETPLVPDVCPQSLAHDSHQLLLLTKAFMGVSCSAKQSTNKKADKFWEKISQHFEELVVTTNKLNKKNPEYEAIETN